MKKISILLGLFTILAFQTTSLCAMESVTTKDELTVDAEMDRPPIKRALEIDEEIDPSPEGMEILHENYTSRESYTPVDMYTCEEIGAPEVKRKKLLRVEDLYCFEQIRGLLENTNQKFFLEKSEFCIDGCSNIIKNLDIKIASLKGFEKKEMLVIRDQLNNACLKLSLKVLEAEAADELIEQFDEMDLSK